MKNACYDIVIPMSKKWWNNLLLGLLFMSIGILVFMTPLTGYISLTIFFSLVIATTGAFEIIASFSYKETGRDWGWYFAEGFFDIWIAAHLMWNPLVSMSLLPYIIGIWLLYKSVLAISIPLELKSLNHKGWGWMLTLGIATMIFAPLILFYSLIGGLSIINATAFAFLTFGIFHISVAHILKRLRIKRKTFQIS